VNSTYLLDTHTLIWYFTGSARLKKKAREVIDDCRNRGGKLLIPTIVLSEALDIAEKGKAEFDFAKMYKLIQTEAEFEIIGFSPEIFVTKDQIIRESGKVEVL